MRLLSTLFITIIAGTFLTTTAFAASAPAPSGCQPLYNGGDFCKNSDVLTINKKVLKPGTPSVAGQSYKDSDFIENISSTDSRYLANTPTAFRISLTNTTNGVLKNIVVKDIFPPRFLTFVSGSGTYDDTSRTFSSTIAELKAKETKHLIIQVLTARPDELPTDDNALCTINLAIATVNNKESQDTAQICVSRQEQVAGLTIPEKPSQNPTVSKGGLPIVSPATPQTAKTTPKTGPEMAVLFSLIPAAGAGLLLRRKTSLA